MATLPIDRAMNNNRCMNPTLTIAFQRIILNSAVKEDENGADAQKHEGF
jgi:hypothetical protein